MRKFGLQSFLLGLFTISILCVTFWLVTINGQLAYVGGLTQQYLRDNSLLRSTHFTQAPLLVNHTKQPRVLFYTFIGCTFDATACGYLSGCKNSFKVCDSSAPSSTCNVTLDGTYSYKTLGFKNHEFINYMCKEQLADSYDVFVKVDDDVLYDPEHITDVIAHMDIAEHSLLGFLRLDKTVVWPSGPIYAYTSNTLRSLCSNKKAIGRTGGMHEDLRFGHALSLISQLQYYNMDNLIDAIHLQYRSSRMFVQFMQYGKCANKNNNKEV